MQMNFGIFSLLEELQGELSQGIQQSVCQSWGKGGTVWQGQVENGKPPSGSMMPYGREGNAAGQRKKPAVEAGLYVRLSMKINGAECRWNRGTSLKNVIGVLKAV